MVDKRHLLPLIIFDFLVLVFYFLFLQFFFSVSILDTTKNQKGKPKNQNIKNKKPKRKSKELKSKNPRDRPVTAKLLH